MEPIAAPIDAARNATSAATAILTWTVNVGSPTAGTLLIVFVRFVNGPGTVTFTGYTLLFGPDTSDASDDETRIYYRWADGSEGATDTFTTTITAKGSAICWQVTGAENPATVVPTVSSVAIGTTTANTADPGSAAGSSADCLYLAMAAGDGEAAYTAAPASYGNLAIANSGTSGLPAGNSYSGGASRQILASTSDDPGAFTHGAHTTGWTALTVRITAPASAPAVTVVTRDISLVL